MRRSAAERGAGVDLVPASDLHPVTVTLVKRVPWLVAVGFASRLAGLQAATLLLVFAAFSVDGPALAGVVTAARSVPSVLAPWLAGWWYDRHSPRSLAVLAGLLEVAGLLMWALGSFSTPVALTLLAATLGLTGAVFDTTVTAAVADAGARPLAASVLTGLAFDGGKLVAAAVVWLTQSVGPGWALLAPALALPGIGVLVASAPARALGRATTGRVWGRWALPLLPLLPLLVAANLSVGSLLFWQGLLVGGSPTAFAVVNAALALGAILGNLVLARAGLSRWSLRIGFLLSGFGLLAMAVAGPERLIALGMAAGLWGAGVAWWFQGLRGWAVTSAPAGFRGRASTLLVTVTRLSLTVSGPLLGLLVLLAGPTAAATVAGVAGVCCACAVPRKVRWPSQALDTA